MLKFYPLILVHILNFLDFAIGLSSEPERLTASIGASIDLPCRLPENHLVSWTRDGGALPPNAQQIRNSLRISKVLDQDSGRYICSSSVQTGSRVVELRVEREFNLNFYSSKLLFFKIILLKEHL